jgi:dimethylsulfoniopropionate demethylase
VSGYSVVNHTILPKGFGRSVEADYWHLKQHVQVWDVGCQRQVEVSGPDAARLAQLMTPRDLRRAEIGQCLYAPMVDEQGRMLNDPVILRIDHDRFWFSIADADMLLWAGGLACGLGLDVSVDEPDVWPLAVQGPASELLMSRLFGAGIGRLPFFRFQRRDFRGRSLVVARSGYSRQGGFEIYLDDFSLGTQLWDAIWEAGQDLDIAPGSPNLIERIEGGLLSYGNDMTRQENPLECGMARYCRLDGAVDFIGLPALQRIARKGPQRMIRGVVFDGEPCPPCRQPWPIFVDHARIGHVTSAIWSPRFGCNVALGMIDLAYVEAGTAVTVENGDGSVTRGAVVDLPMTESGVTIR